jgi:CelD/BcsL family acetyltransferase involved in cellulose biosynthesis
VTRAGEQAVDVGSGRRWSLDRIDALEDARDDWDRLAEGAGHPFATWEWVRPWWRHQGEGKRLYTFVCRDAEGETVAILPMYVASERPLRVARFLGYGSLSSPLCAPADRAAAGLAVRAAIGAGHDRCRLLYAEKLPGDQGWDEALGGRLVTVHPDPAVRIEGRTWEELLATGSSKLRSKVRYEERRLARDHELRFRLSDATHLEQDLETLFRLHGARWGEATTGVFEGGRSEMHREIASGMLARGRLRLWIEELDSEPVAAYYGFRFAGCEWFYQSGRDPQFDRLSVGSVMLGHVIREACESGAREFRFLEGAEAYKLRFSDADYEAQTRVLGSGVRGRIGLGALAAVRAAPDGVRERLVRVAQRI